MLGSVLSGALALVGVVAVYAVLLRPSGGGARSRRHWLVDGRHRDRGRLLPIVLAGVAVADLDGLYPGASLGVSFVTGLALAALSLTPALRIPVFTAIGGLAVLAEARKLFVSVPSDGHLGTGASELALLVVGVALLAVAASRLVFAPLRASGAEASGATLAVYGVFQSGVLIGSLRQAGEFSPRLGDLALLVLIGVVLAVGLAVMPNFATSALGVGLAVTELLLAAAADSAARSDLVAVMLGLFFPTLLHRGLAARRSGQSARTA